MDVYNGQKKFVLPVPKQPLLRQSGAKPKLGAKPSWEPAAKKQMAEPAAKKQKHDDPPTKKTIDDLYAEPAAKKQKHDDRPEKHDDPPTKKTIDDLYADAPSDRYQSDTRSTTSTSSTHEQEQHHDEQELARSAEDSAREMRDYMDFGIWVDLDPIEDSSIPLILFTSRIQNSELCILSSAL